jgi:hypothetical protein
MATQFATRADELRNIRASLRDRLEDRRRRVPAQVARALESSLRQMWQRWCAGLPACVLDCGTGIAAGADGVPLFSNDGAKENT